MSTDLLATLREIINITNGRLTVLPINSSTSADELERMLYPINPELASMVAAQIEADDLFRESCDERMSELAGDVAALREQAAANYERYRKAERDFYNLRQAILSIPRVPEALKRLVR